MLDDLAAVLDRLCEAEPATLADGDAVVALHRQLARLAAVVTRASAAFDASGRWGADGARSAAAWLATRCGLPAGAARHSVALGRSLRHLPATEAAWLAGEVGPAQVAVLARARTEVTAEAMARDESLLVGQARSLRAEHFVRTVAYWSHHADPEGAERAADRQQERRRFHLSQSFAGQWVGDIVLDPVRGAAVAAQLRRIEDELFAADRAEASQPRGEGAGADGMARTAAQRRADALVEMAARAGAAPAGARRPEPLISVLVGYDAFAAICELADGTPVAPGMVARWLGDAWVERVVFDGPSRIVDLGVARRLFQGATRRAVILRDRECFHPYCDERAESCQVDHIQPWAAGGPTTMDNGRVACGFHNRGRHQRRGPPPAA